MSCHKAVGEIAIFMALLVVSLPVTLASELNLVYDANGNLVSGDGLYREYNSLNQLWKIYNGSNSSGTLLEELTHHPVEERILLKKVYNGNGSIKERVIYVSRTFVRVINDSGTFDYTYVYHEGQLVAQLNPDGSKIFIHSDHEGSSSVITNATGAVIENTTYSPHGEILSGGTVSRFNYEGKEHDTLVGDTDFHARKYLTSIDIYGQPDTLIQNVYDPQSLNRYMFERGNTYKNKDESGHQIEEILFGILFIWGIYLLGTAKLAKRNLEVEKAEAEDDEKKIVKAKLGFYAEAVTSGAQVSALPMELATDALKTGFEMTFDLVTQSMTSAMITHNRNALIKTALADYGKPSSARVDASSSQSENRDLFGIRYLLNSWLDKDSQRKTALEKALAGGGSGGGSSASSAGSGGGSSSGGTIVTIGGKRYRCTNCRSKSK